MRITVNKEYKCVRSCGRPVQELEVWKVIAIHNMNIWIQRGDKKYGVDKRVFPVMFEAVKE